MNILHLAPDEKFILFFDSVFSTLPGVANRYLIEADPQEPFKHVNGLDVWRVVGRDYFSSPQLIEDLRWAECLIVHYLGINGARMILKAPAGVARVWSGWGGDYYQFMPGGERAFLGEETTRLIEDLPIPKQKVSERFLAIVPLIKHTALKRFLVIPALRKVDYFSAPIKSDIVFLQRALGKQFTAEYVQLNYGSVKETFTAGGRTFHGNNILLGNSATPTNNHLEIFRMLEIEDLGERKLIVPLSYGLPEYRKAIIERGRAIFRERFVPICDYLPLPDYNKLISQCSIVIMNHRRQQALGNIGAMLYRGAKVFLDEGGPVYAFFKERGAHVFATSLLSKHSDSPFDPLTEQQVEINREVLELEWGQAIVNKNAAEFMSRIRIHNGQRASLQTT